MPERTRTIDALLRLPRIYEAVQHLLGARAARRRFARDYLPPQARAKVLDIGCGTGSFLDDLPSDVEYTGFDVNARYVAAASARYEGRARFIHARVGDELPLSPATFDIAMARAVMHHLDDAGVRALLETARRYLRPGAVFVSIDPALHAGQSLVSRLLVSADRGQNVRTPERYTELVREVFPDAQCWLVRDLLRVPYSHCVTRAGAPECKRPRFCAAVSRLRRASRYFTGNAPGRSAL